MSEVSVQLSALPGGKAPYLRAISPTLRYFLQALFLLVALLGANSVYLGAVTWLEWRKPGVVYQNFFYQYMFLAHLVLGLVLVPVFLVFSLRHMGNTWTRKNRRAVRAGVGTFVAGLVVLATGVLLMRVGNLQIKTPGARSLLYWLHVLVPLVAVWLYLLHRLAGPRLKWRVGLGWLVATAAVAGLMVWFHAQDPRRWSAVGPKEGARYFSPSLARTATGNFIPARTLMMDDYCRKCHADAYEGWFHSAHHFSSFNNRPYLASVRETREVSLQRDGTVKASRWCAGCHDLVPFFSGAFDDPAFDLEKHPTSQAGITCTSCHSIVNVNSTQGNGDYTIEEPLHYPFAFSSNSILRFLNETLVKAKPDFHRKTFLKPAHRTAEFCSVCHKVSLPFELNRYKEFLRGQNHYDTYLLSGKLPVQQQC